MYAMSRERRGLLLIFVWKQLFKVMFGVDNTFIYYTYIIILIEMNTHP